MIKQFLYFTSGVIFRLIKTLRCKLISDYASILKDKLYTMWILSDLGSYNPHINLQRSSVFRGRKKIYIGEYTTIQRNSCIEAIEKYYDNEFSPEIRIGKNVNIGEYNHITAIKSIVIGDGVLTGRRVTISDNNHGEFERSELDIIPQYRDLSCKGAVIIENNVWIGENVCILSGVKVGKGCVIAANAVVTKDIPPYSLAAGVPAKVIKQFKV